VAYILGYPVLFLNISPTYMVAQKVSNYQMMKKSY